MPYSKIEITTDMTPDELDDVRILNEAIDVFDDVITRSIKHDLPYPDEDEVERVFLTIIHQSPPDKQYCFDLDDAERIKVIHTRYIESVPEEIAVGNLKLMQELADGKYAQ